MRGQLNIVTPEEFKAWGDEMSELAKRSHDPDDPGANWGWPWEADAEDQG